MTQLRFRQIHLDFHTSPAIEAVGAQFDRHEWRQSLQAGHVDSITCFAKCHHGWSYHPTAVGRMHPHLLFDLLREQMNICKELDINVPVYISAGLDNVAASEHPEWRPIGVDGSYTGWSKSPLQAGFHKLCFASPYLHYLCAQTEETVRLFPDADGIFFDIVGQDQCCCRWCLEGMAAAGLDADCEAARQRWTVMVLEQYYQRTTAAARQLDPDMPVFHNSGHLQRGNRTILPYFSHLELESLPTGGWGYDHFPLSALYCRNLGKDYLGMTGKFHTTWGEFGGYKHPNALRYECAAMLAYGAKCSVGDQLHPCGRLDAATYRNIGIAYEEVERKEKWCRDTRSVSDIGLLSCAAINAALSRERDHSADVGSLRVLLEDHFLFDILDADMDFSNYKVLVLPDDIVPAQDLKAKIDNYLLQGGKLMLSGRSGIGDNGFLFDVGGEYVGPAAFALDYVYPIEELRSDFVDAPLVMYAPAHRVRATDGYSLGQVYEPYFNRTFRHFCSHQHAPARLEPNGYDCGIWNGRNILYVAHPVFTIYRGLGAVAYRHYAARALDRLLGHERTLVTDLPSTARVTLAEQPQNNCYILHLLYANTINRGGAMELSGGTVSSFDRSVEVIDELLPLFDINVTLNLPRAITQVCLEPESKNLSFQSHENKVTFKLPKLLCHQMVVLQYAC